MDLFDALFKYSRSKKEFLDTKNLNELSEKTVNNFIIDYLDYVGLCDVSAIFKTETESEGYCTYPENDKRAKITQLFIDNEYCEAFKLIESIAPNFKSTYNDTYVKIMILQFLKILHTGKRQDAFHFFQDEISHVLISDSKVKSQAYDALSLLAYSDPWSIEDSYFSTLNYKHSLLLDVNQSIVKCIDSSIEEPSLLKLFRCYKYSEDKILGETDGDSIDSMFDKYFELDDVSSSE